MPEGQAAVSTQLVGVFYADLLRGTILALRRVLTRRQVEEKDRFLGFFRSPQQATLLVAGGGQGIITKIIKKFEASGVGRSAGPFSYGKLVAD